jgi:hypothetical protein
MWHKICEYVSMRPLNFISGNFWSRPYFAKYNASRVCRCAILYPLCGWQCMLCRTAHPVSLLCWLVNLQQYVCMFIKWRLSQSSAYFENVRTPNWSTKHVGFMVILKDLCSRRTRFYLMFVDPCIIVQFIKKKPTKCNNVSKFYYSIFIWSSTCFGRHPAHHQEPKTALAASGFSYVEGCWTCRW